MQQGLHGYVYATEPGLNLRLALENFETRSQQGARICDGIYPPATHGPTCRPDGCAIQLYS